MVKFYTLLVVLISFGLQAFSQADEKNSASGIKKRKSSRTETKSADSKTSSVSGADKKQESENARMAAKMQSRVTPENIAKIKLNLAEDQFGNLTKPVILLPYNLENPEQKQAFLRLKTVVESQRPTSTFISNTKKEYVGFVINSKEAFATWETLHPEMLLAFIFHGEEAMEASTEKQVRNQLNMGFLKLMAIQLVRRQAPSGPQPVNQESAPPVGLN